MRVPPRRIALLWTSFSLVLSCCRAPAPEVREEAVASPRAVLEEAVREGLVPGAVGLIAVDGEVIFREAFGWKDIEAQDPMTEDTIFRIASMTKPVTSTAVMMLVEEGRLALDDPVSRFIPEFAHPNVVESGSNGDGSVVPALGEITIRHLLTHTAGISYRFSGIEPLTSLYAEAGISDGLTQTEGTIGQGMTRLAKMPLLHEPGTAWKYGLSTDVLGYVVEVVSQETLELFFRERIFEPLGMKDTYFYLPEDRVSRLASVYRPVRDGLRKLGEEPIQEGPVLFSTSYQYRGPRTYFSGGAGLVSTMDDYYRFCQMILNGGELDGVRLLRQDTVDSMTSNQVGDLNVGEGKVGFGFSIESGEGRLAWSWGGFFFTRFWIEPGEKAVGIFMSQLWPNQRSPVDDVFRRAADEWIRADPT
ncbi:MAG: serine hydrolase domain-containing protein [Vicinamibacteria bacterium]